MASGAQIQAKIKAVLKRLEATPRVVKFREVTQTGGNTLLGIGGTVVVTDTDIDPQPAAQMIKSETIVGNGKLALPGDWEFTFDGTINENQFRTKQLLFGDEVLNIVHFEPFALNKITVGYTVIGRTVTPRS